LLNSKNRIASWAGYALADGTFFRAHKFLELLLGFSAPTISG